MATPPDFSVGQILTAAQMNQIGLWKVASGTLTVGTSFVNVTGVFDNTKYSNYRVILNATARPASSRLELRFLDGTTASQAGYFGGGLAGNYSSDAVVYYQRSNNDNRLYMGIANTIEAVWIFDLVNVDKAARTLYHGTMTDAFSGYSYSWGGVHTPTTAYDGFALAGTNATAMTIDYQVFGYRN